MDTGFWGIYTEIARIAQGGAFKKAPFAVALGRSPDEERLHALGRLIQDPDALLCLFAGALSLEKETSKKKRGRSKVQISKDCRRAKAILVLANNLRHVGRQPPSVREMITLATEEERCNGVEPKHCLFRDVTQGSLETSISAGKVALGIDDNWSLT